MKGNKKRVAELIELGYASTELWGDVMGLNQRGTLHILNSLVASGEWEREAVGGRGFFWRLADALS